MKLIRVFVTGIVVIMLLGGCAVIPYGWDTPLLIVNCPTDGYGGRSLCSQEQIQRKYWIPGHFHRICHDDRYGSSSCRGVWVPGRYE